MIEKINAFLKGYQKDGFRERPTTFWRYFIFYPINWLCVIAYSGFIGLFVQGGVKYESPLLWTATLFPIIVLAYHIIDEYYAFQWYATGFRKVSAKTLQNIAKWCCSIVMLYLIVRVFVTG